MNILFFFKSVFLIIFSVAVTNILHFYVEDLYLDHSVRSWVLGSSYGLSASWMLIAGLAFFVCHFLQQRFCAFDEAYFKDRLRYSFIFALLCVFTFMSAFYVVKVVANFLEGYASVSALLRALITILFFALGALYAFLEMKKGELVKTKHYALGLSIGVGLLTLMGMTIFLCQASPSQMRIARQDAQRVRDIKMIDDKLQGYYRKKGELPQSLPQNIEDLMSKGTSGDQSESTREDYAYKIIDPSTFELCTTLYSKKSLFERVGFSFQGLSHAYYSGSIYPTLHYFPGRRCQKVKLTLEDEVSIKGKPYKKVSAFYNFKGNLYMR
jgi:hypothetical protein